MKYPVRLCSDAYGIERCDANSRAELMSRLVELLDSAEAMISTDERKEISFRLCIDIGQYDEV